MRPPLRTAAPCVVLALLGGCDRLFGPFIEPLAPGDLAAAPDLAAAADLAAPCGGDGGPCADPCPAGDRCVDVLFLVDNSRGMAAKQRALAEALPAFLAQLDPAASYHLGVASSDVGIYPMEGQVGWPSLGKCDTFAGDDGLLQRLPCSARAGSSEADSGCLALCADPGYAPPRDAPFVAVAHGKNNVRPGQADAPARALRCMVLLKDEGCGIEGPLEGARRALDGRNRGFLRAGSVLALITLTDEDDCSVADRTKNEPVTRDCATPDAEAPWDCFDPDYRCMARSVRCAQPMNTGGAKTGCQERDSHLVPVAEYAGALKGLRPADHLVVAGIHALPRLDGGGGALTTGYDRRVMASDRLNRTPVCAAAGDPTFTAAPQLRMSRFAGQFPGSIEHGVCEPAGYGDALERVAAAINAKLGR